MPATPRDSIVARRPGIPGSAAARRRVGRAAVVAAGLGVAVSLAAGPLPAGAAASAAISTASAPHVFVINLENKSYDETWGPGSHAPYLAVTLRRQGRFLTNYYSIAHVSLPNYIAEISGQGPNPATQADCGSYTPFVPTGTAAVGQLLGSGCVFPASVQTIADQLTAKGLTWKSYQEDMANSATEPTTCRHPVLGQSDPTLLARVGDQYATRHDPFVYFQSIIGSPACNTDVVDLRALPGDLASASTTPNLAFITPNLCDDGHDASCVDGRPGGLVSANAWLQTWVSKILASPAYRKNGVVVITFDEAEVPGALNADSTSCCNEQKPPNVAQAGTNGPGGGRVGAVVLSRSVKPGSTDPTPYNHYSLLCGLENTFGLTRLGYAGQPGLRCVPTSLLSAKR